jgi:glycosyltransferase involved in cell wall biosynthesis
MITVLFSSHNGGPDLRRMMDSLVGLESPDGGWQLVAIDNASTDGTGDLLRSYADRVPMRVLTEPLKGKNRALNLGLGQAEGDLYIFTDDDVIVPKDWLVRWRAVANAQPEYDVFGGSTRPLWPYDPPRWIKDWVNVQVVFASHENMHDGPCDTGYVWGTNMAIRASVFRRGATFDASIGPDGSSNYAMGSDTELARRLEGEGAKCWFATEPFVDHIIPPEYLDRRWILNRGFRWGRGLARMGFPYPYGAEQLALRNRLRRLLYPLVFPLMAEESRWRRSWSLVVDQGYEAGSRENDAA